MKSNCCKHFFSWSTTLLVLLSFIPGTTLNTQVYPYKDNQTTMHVLAASPGKLVSATRSMIYAYDLAQGKADSMSPAQGWPLSLLYQVEFLPDGSFLALQKDPGSVIAWAVSHWTPGSQPVWDSLKGVPSNKIPLGIECCWQDAPLVLAHNGLGIQQGSLWEWIDAPWDSVDDFSISLFNLWSVTNHGVWRLKLADSIKQTISYMLEGENVMIDTVYELWMDTLWIADDDLDVPNSISNRIIQVDPDSGAWVGLEGYVAYISRTDSLVRSWKLPKFGLVTDIDFISQDTLLVTVSSGVYRCGLQRHPLISQWQLDFLDLETGSSGLNELDSVNGQWFGAGSQGFMKRVQGQWQVLFQPSGLDFHLKNISFYQNNDQLWLHGYQLSQKPRALHPLNYSWVIAESDSSFWYYEGAWFYSNENHQVKTLGDGLYPADFSLSKDLSLIAWASDSILYLSSDPIEVQALPSGNLKKSTFINDSIFLLTCCSVWMGYQKSYSLFRDSISGMSSSGNTLFLWDSDSIYQISPDKSEQSYPIPQDLQISDVLLSGDSLWVSVRFGGLWLYLKGQWRLFTTLDGLGDNRIREIALDADHNLWLLGDLNLTRIELYPGSVAIPDPRHFSRPISGSLDQRLFNVKGQESSFSKHQRWFNR